jgi:hypothetical protein
MTFRALVLAYLHDDDARRSPWSGLLVQSLRSRSPRQMRERRAFLARQPMSRLSTRVGVRGVLSTGEASMLPLISGFWGKARKAVSRLFTQAGSREAWTEQGRGGAGREAARKSTAVERRLVASAGEMRFWDLADCLSCGTREKALAPMFLSCGPSKSVTWTSPCPTAGARAPSASSPTSHVRSCFREELGQVLGSAGFDSAFSRPPSRR